MKSIKPFLFQYGLYFAWFVSIVATFGSLYFSQIKGFVPCTLCWYQRIFMYPQTILLGIACYQNDKSVIKFVLPMSVIGGSISLWHYLEQKVPGFADVIPCTTGVPCHVAYINWLGFITIPFLAFCGFTLIFTFLWFARKK